MTAVELPVYEMFALELTAVSHDVCINAERLQVPTHEL